MHQFCIFPLKHRLWLLVRTVLRGIHDLCFEQKIRKLSSFYLKIIVFKSVKNPSKLYRHLDMSVRIMTRNVTRLRGFVVRIPGNSFLVTRFIVVDSGLMSRTQMCIIYDRCHFTTGGR